ncbi:MAG TPA: PRC-barrel domain containing protein [Nitrolancea sp.]|nr:PRC-barrel domain containing protein [Nitrolancea sp.]
MAVYDQRNHRVGTVQKVYPLTQDHEFYIRVGTGLFGPEVCLPAHFLSVWNNQIGVGLDKKQIKQLGGTLCPTGIRGS